MELLTFRCGHSEEWEAKPEGNFTVEALRKMWQKENCSQCEDQDKNRIGSKR